jgi:L-seryl-tRNA(Ser) seleniumtransferase
VATAACVAGADPAKIRALPHLDWLGAKDQVVIEKTHVTGFAQAFCAAGPRLVVIGGPEGATPDEYAAVISGRTAAVAFCGGELPGNSRFPTRTPLADLVALAHGRGAPVIVDAAAELPPPEHLRRFSELGADYVVFSGGKGLRGPQASGLVLGKAQFIAACRLNQNPHSSIGRGMKVGKEEICGLVKAVEVYLARDYAADLRYWDACAQLSSTPSATWTGSPPSASSPAPFPRRSSRSMPCGPGLAPPSSPPGWPKTTPACAPD